MVRKFPPLVRYPHLVIKQGMWVVLKYRSCVNAEWYNEAKKWAEKQNESRRA